MGVTFTGSLGGREKVSHAMVSTTQGGKSSEPADLQPTLHCCALPCIALFCFVLCCIALHRIAFPCFALHCFALLCFALYCTALHCFALLCIACFAGLFIALHCIALLRFAFQCFALSDGEPGSGVPENLERAGSGETANLPWEKTKL